MSKIDLAIPIPKTFQGRTITNRGVHLQDFGYHQTLMQDPGPWIQRLHDMSISFVVALTESDSFYASGAAQLFLDSGIIPITRFIPSNIPKAFTDMVAVEQIVDLCAQYGVPPLFCYLNEPYDEREYFNEKPSDPDELWEMWTDCWRQGAQIITGLGGIVGIPDGPTFDRNPFPYLTPGMENKFADGWVFFAGHYYGLNRPRDYPYDDAQRLGIPMTPQEYEDALDDFAEFPEWRDPPLDILNQERWEKKNPTLRADLPHGQGGDPVCFLGYTMVEKFMDDALGYKIPHAMTEGGWTPKARAGTGPETFELRYLMPTCHKVAEKTLAMYEHDSPMFALAPWLLASQYLGGGGWEDDAWCGGGAYWPWYGFEKPVIDILKENPPTQCNVPGVIEKLNDVLSLLGGSILDLADC